MVRKPCVIFLSIPCHWNRMVIFWPQVLHLTPDFRIIKIQSFVLLDKLNLAFHLPSSLHTSSFFWNNANVPIWPKKRLIFLNLSFYLGENAGSLLNIESIERNTVIGISPISIFQMYNLNGFEYSFDSNIFIPKPKRIGENASYPLRQIKMI